VTKIAFGVVLHEMLMVRKPQRMPEEAARPPWR
jgi:hypothetical protein